MISAGRVPWSKEGILVQDYCYSPSGEGEGRTVSFWWEA